MIGGATAWRRGDRLQTDDGGVVQRLRTEAEAIEEWLSGLERAGWSFDVDKAGRVTCIQPDGYTGPLPGPFEVRRALQSRAAAATEVPTERTWYAPKGPGGYRELTRLLGGIVTAVTHKPADGGGAWTVTIDNHRIELGDGRAIINDNPELLRALWRVAARRP